MKTQNKIAKPNLVAQIESVKNYQQHRSRLCQTRYCSPLASLKKSMSYDKSKYILHEHIKKRRQYTSTYKRREQMRNNEMRDSKMLQNILEYDQKYFVFSLNKNQITENLLHHNSIVSGNKNNQQIDQENQKIHFRITKAKSLYSHLFPCKSLTSSSRVFKSTDKFNDKYQKSLHEKLNTQTDMPNMEQTITDNQFSRGNNFQISVQNLNSELSRHKYNNQSANFTNNNFFRTQISQSSRRMCDRVRRQKLAQKLYQKKQKWQKSILSKIKVVRP